MTKYIEEHNFNFDNVFDEKADNNLVRALTSLINLDLPDVCLAVD